MMRYLRLYAYFVGFSISRSLEFRFDFFFRVLMDSIFYIVNILFFKVLMQKTPLIAGWNESQVMIFVATYCVIDALQMTFFSNNMWMLPELVNKGDLDYYLLRPVSSLFFICLRDFAVNSFLNLLISVGILIWALQSYSGSFQISHLLLYLLFTINGVLLFNLIHLSLLLPVFWMHSSRGLEQFFWASMKILDKPAGIFSGYFRKIITFIIPFALITTFPVTALFENLDWRAWATVIGATIWVWLLTLGIWNRALKSYSSASS